MFFRKTNETNETNEEKIMNLKKQRDALINENKENCFRNVFPYGNNGGINGENKKKLDKCNNQNTEQEKENKKKHDIQIKHINDKIKNLENTSLSQGGKRRTKRRRQRSNKKRTNKRKKTKTRMKKRKTHKRKTNKRRRKR